MVRRVIPTAFPPSPKLTSCQELGAAIRAARTSGGLALEDAALALGISKQTMTDLELGRPTVRIETALRAAKAMGLSLFMAPTEAAEPILRAIETTRATKERDIEA